MTKKLLLIIFTTYIFTGCYISNEIENNFAKAFEIILPDTCEIYMIAQIYNYRELNGMLPSNNEIPLLFDSINSGCQLKLDSVGVILYNSDSIDLTMQKNLKSINDTTDFFVTKAYRIIFENDSMRIEYLDAYGKINSKYQNRRFKTKEGQIKTK